MIVNLSFSINPLLYKKNPEASEVGRGILIHSIALIHEIGIENFTFKKLSSKIHHTEATIYRYFENKQMLLLYIVSWYWHYLSFLIEFKTQNLKDSKQKIEEVLNILGKNLNTSNVSTWLDLGAIYHIVIREGNKVYLLPEVKEINKSEAYQPYKDLCAMIAELFVSYQPSYPYPHSLASTLVETSHLQIFFIENLPRLTDISSEKNPDYLYQYLKHFIFKSLN